MTEKYAVIGGGISGVLAALAINQSNQVDLYEQRPQLLQGPPYCHLHAGGFLYPNVPLPDCEILLSQCLEFAQAFPESMFHRPSIIAFKAESRYETKELLDKCLFVRTAYHNWHKLNDDAPLGHPDTYFAIYSRDDALHYKSKGSLPDTDDPAKQYHNAYVSTFFGLLKDINSIKYPFASVREPGINQVSVEAALTERLSKAKNINVILNVKATVIHNLNWKVNEKDYDFLINATGPKSSQISLKRAPEILELKSSWIIQGEHLEFMPEIALIGERGTDAGMTQVTPVGNGLYQVHLMTSDSTIIHAATLDSNNPFPPEFHDDNIKSRIDGEMEARTQAAINSIASYFPLFSSSLVITSKCWGLQRTVVGELGADKRTSDLIVDRGLGYVEFRTVKASSSVSMARSLSELNLNKI